MLHRPTWVQLACASILILGTVMVGPTAVGASTGHVHPSAKGASADHAHHANDAGKAVGHGADHAAGRSADHATGRSSAAGFGDTSAPQPLSTADLNTGGANGQCPGGPYCSTRDGAPSLNGSGNGQATGRPCAGCVGRADNKNPAGQFPNGTDPNAGYECDRNSGVGQTNPAHTGCRTILKPPELPPEQPPIIITPPGVVVPPVHVPPQQPPGPPVLPPTGAGSGSGLTGVLGLMLVAVGGWLVQGRKRPVSGM